jgi:putative transcriptional regulator
MDQIALRDALCQAYAAGALSPAMALMVDTQATLAPAVRAQRDAAETAAAALFEREAAPALSFSLDDVLARVGVQEMPPQAPRVDDPIGAELARLPAPLRDAALAAAAAGERWRFASPGMRTLALNIEGGGRAELFRIKPGHGAPMHTHNGEEFTLLIEGAFHDGHARFGVGDIAYATPALTHRPIAEPGPICYAFAVTDAPLKFRGALGVVQQLFG